MIVALLGAAASTAAVPASCRQYMTMRESRSTPTPAFQAQLARLAQQCTKDKRQPPGKRPTGQRPPGAAAGADPCARLNAMMKLGDRVNRTTITALQQQCSQRRTTAAQALPLPGANLPTAQLPSPAGPVADDGTGDQAALDLTTAETAESTPSSAWQWVKDNKWYIVGGAAGLTVLGWLIKR